MAEHRTAQQKGNALEQAVKFIENSILNQVPSAAGQKFTIENKKLIKVNNVPHEIDVHVTVHFVAGYEATFVFECKNWARPVGKNEIIIFSEKIQAIGAAHGYFVARSFTAGARAQAEQSKRITALIVKEYDPILIAPELTQAGMEWWVDGVGHRMTATDGCLLGPHVPGEVSYRGGQVTFQNLLALWANEITDEIRRSEHTAKHPFFDLKAGGIHEADFLFSRQFAAGELHIAGKDVQKVDGFVRLKAFIYHEVIDYSFDIPTRGRIIAFRPVQLPSGATLRSRIITTYKQRT
jgi:hypothetical protein